MAHKLPIIATNIGAIPDFVIESKNGHMVEPNNPQQLARKIIELIGSADTSIGEHGHKLFWDTYTWEKTGIRIHENVEKFLAWK